MKPPPPNRESSPGTTARPAEQRSGETRRSASGDAGKARMRGVVGQRLLHGVEHARHVAAVLGMVMDGELDAVPLVARDRVAGRHHRPEIQDRRSVRSERLATAPGAPFALEIARRERNLIGAGRDGGEKRMKSASALMKLRRRCATCRRAAMPGSGSRP